MAPPRVHQRRYEDNTLYTILVVGLLLLVVVLLCTKRSLSAILLLVVALLAQVTHIMWFQERPTSVALDADDVPTFSPPPPSFRSSPSLSQPRGGGSTAPQVASSFPPLPLVQPRRLHVRPSRAARSAMDRHMAAIAAEAADAVPRRLRVVKQGR